MTREALAALSVLLVAGLAFCLWWFGFRRPRTAELEPRLRFLAQSGPVMAQMACDGGVGWLYWNNVNFEVAVYPGGLVVDGFLLGMRVVLASEIRGVRWVRPWFFLQLAVDHDGVDCLSPVRVRTRRDSALAAAILSLADGEAASR